MKVHSSFFGGSIDYRGLSPDGNIILRLRRDPQTGSAQSFYFRLDGTAQPRQLVIENAGTSSFPKGWENYQAFTSPDDSNWSRTQTTFVDGQLIIEHRATSPATWYSSFPPYKPANHSALLKLCAQDERVVVRNLCNASPRDKVELLSIGSKQPEALNIWILARQHPAETQASWWIEGFLRALLDIGNPASQALLHHARFHIVPNMNPDGSRHGLYRTNIHGRNLNASWDIASVKTTPAVHAVVSQMERTGMDFCIDVHADEELPYIFVANVDRILPLPPAITTVLDAFEHHLHRLEPGFRPRSGILRPHTKANPLSFCAPFLMNRFARPAVTLELPFKQINTGTNDVTEFGIEGCIRTGQASLKAIAFCLDKLCGMKHGPACRS